MMSTSLMLPASNKAKDEASSGSQIREPISKVQPKKRVNECSQWERTNQQVQSNMRMNQQRIHPQRIKPVYAVNEKYEPAESAAAAAAVAAAAAAAAAAINLSATCACNASVEAHVNTRTPTKLTANLS